MAEANSSLFTIHSSLKNGNKKDVGVMSLRAYPNNQAFALPLKKDKQRKACPRRAIYMHTLRHTDSRLVYIHKESMAIAGIHLIIYIRRELWPQGDIKSTHADVSVALPLSLDSKLRSLIVQTGNVRKRPFETGRTTALGSRSIDVVLTCPPSHEQAFRVQR